MAQLTETQFETLYGTSGTQFPNNTTGLITEAVMRAFGQAIADSLSFGRAASAEVDATNDPMVLSFSSNSDMVFTGSEAIDGDREIQLSGDTNAKKFDFIYEVDDAHAFEMPVTFAFSDPNFNASTNTYQHTGAGFYRLSGIWSGVLWICEVLGPYEYNT